MAKTSNNTSSVKGSTKGSANKKPRATAKAASKTTSAASTANGAVNATSTSFQEVSSEDRNRMIQYAAYHLAEQDGFQPGREQDYWLRAEKQIDDLIKGQQVLNRAPDTGGDIH